MIKLSSEIFQLNSTQIPTSQAVDCYFNEGERVAVVGISGEGKTTFFNKVHQKVEQSAYILQQPFKIFSPALSLKYQLMSYLKRANPLANRAFCYEKLVEQLKSFQLKEADLKKYPHQLSGGMLARFALLAEFIDLPTVVISDEIDANLDLLMLKELYDAILAQQSAHQFVYFFSSHRKSVIEKWATRVLILEDGLLKDDLSIASFLNPKDPIKTQYQQVFLASKQTENAQNLSFNQQNTGPKVVELRRVSKSYGNREVLQPSDLTLYRGETSVLIGQSGAGKTTLARLLATLEGPTTGEITFFNQQKVALIMQHAEDSFNPFVTISKNFEELPLKKKNAQEFSKKLNRYLGLCELDRALLTRYISEVSGGEAQRLAIVRALMLEASLIIGDEITSSLDFSAKQQVLKLLHLLQVKYQLSYLFITHDLEDIETLGHHFLLLKKGGTLTKIDKKSLKMLSTLYEYE